MSAAHSTSAANVKLTTYPSTKDTAGKLLDLSFDGIGDLFKNVPEYASKLAMPLIQGVTRPGNSRAVGQPVEWVFAVIVEHDAETVSIEEVHRRLQVEGIRAVIYSTASHTLATPRWRIVLPLLKPVSVDCYRDLASAVNAAVGGVLSKESWEPSRCYFFGRVRGVDYMVLTTDGLPLDSWALLGESLTFEAARAADEGVSKAAAVPTTTRTGATPADRVRVRAIALSEASEKTVHDLKFALEVIPADDRGSWVRIGNALASLNEAGFGGEGEQLWLDWSMRSSAFKGGDENQWATFKPRDITYRSVFAEADKLDSGWRARAAEAWAKRTEVLDADVPAARHLCTDLANANRILKHFGGDLLVVAGSWYTYDGTRWRLDESRVYRCAGRLSAIIHAEVNALKVKVCGTEQEKDERDAMVSALRRWARRSEMKGAAEQAIGWIRKWLRIEADQLDADPWLLNCLNGTLDLRTGALRPHDPRDYITKLCRLNYRPEAHSALWQETVEKACLEFGLQHKPLSRFLQRWYGYCATGLVSEQKFAIHFGQGSNAKSTITDAVATSLGDYASTAPPELIVSARGGRHPTEIADLRGARMVTSSESGQSGELREEFVKQATGGDKLKGRLMRQDFFEFEPTHKLQLITNHRPTIRGTDYGIWRRVLLIPYRAKFVTAEELAAGIGHYVKDTEFSVKDAFGTRGPIENREAVLAWIVEGAIEWARDGLKAPDVVLVASMEYQADQDRVGQFVEECCELNPEFSEVLGGEWGGMYMAYRDWCKENGHFPLSSGKLMTELERVVPGFRKGEQKKLGARAVKRRTTRVLHGVRLLPEAE